VVVVVVELPRRVEVAPPPPISKPPCVFGSESSIMLHLHSDVKIPPVFALDYERFDQRYFVLPRIDVLCSNR